MKALRATSGERIRVLIMDDQSMVRQGLRRFMELHDDSAKLAIEVAGEAVNVIEAIDLARRAQPDIILLDLVMPEMDGILATPRILECSPQSRVIILTSFGEEDRVIPAIQAGAQGYLLEDIAPDRLTIPDKILKCIRRVIFSVYTPSKESSNASKPKLAPGLDSEGASPGRQYR